MPTFSFLRFCRALVSSDRTTHSAHPLPLGTIVGLFAGLALVFVTGCGKQAPPPAEIQKLLNDPSQAVIRLGFYGFVKDLNPLLNQEDGERLLSRLIHAAPLRKSGPASWTGDLWASWTAAVNPAGNLEMTGIWKENLTWHDGRPFSARDVEFTFAAMKHPDNGSPYARLAERLLSVTTLENGSSCRLEWQGVSNQYFELLCAGLLPAHLLEGQKLSDAVVPLASGVESLSFGLASGQARFAEQPVGLGPFTIEGGRLRRFMRLTSVKAADPAVTAADKTPALQHLLVKFFFRPEELVDDLRGGRIDWVKIPSEFALELEKLKIPGVRFARHANRSILTLGFNLKRAPFSHPELRQAINEAISRKTLKDVIPFTGRLFQTPGQYLATATELPAPEIGLENAKKRLDAANMLDTNNDGIREFDGKPLTMNIVYNQDNFLRKLVAEAIQADLKKVGISVQIQPLNWAELIGKHLEKQDFDAYLLAFQLPAGGNWLSLWHSQAIPGATAANVSTGKLLEPLNYSGFADPAVDAALEALDGYPVPENAADLQQQILTRLTEQTAACFLFAPDDIVVYSDKLHGIDPEREIWEQRIADWKRDYLATPGTSG
jgi:peptide/nickel transport system substrate-binding protein